MAIVPGLMSYSYHLSWADGTMTPRRFMDQAAQLGLQTVEWCHFPCHAPGEVDWEQVELLSQLGRERGIACQVSGFAPLLADEHARAEMLDMVKTQLTVSDVIGAKCLRFDGMLNKKLRSGQQAPLDICTENLKRVVALGEQAAVTIALEDHTVLRTDDFRRFCSEIESPFFAITLDTGNLVPVGEDAASFAREFAPKIVNCHFKSVGYVFRDYGMVLTGVEPGHSVVDLRSILETFHGQNHAVTVHVEVVAMDAAMEEGLVRHTAQFVTDFVRDAAV